MPRLLFFRFVSPDLPKYIQMHLQQHVKCLSQFFEVILIDQECDYGRVCDKYEPDLTLFESGVYAGQRRITNISAFPEIPKIGLCNADAYCVTRNVFISDMERWGVETYFSISVSLGEYTPEIADRLFVWPNFADGDLHRDYGESKVIPVLFTGSRATHYPWRNRILDQVSAGYPSLVCPHFGWFSERETSRMIFGEQYARMINASWVSPTCGTIAKDVIRKHFEIPACKACLITERTPSIEAAGFSDMENCVFADDVDVMDKLDYLFKNPEELMRISGNGYQLVHSRHTLKQRSQILQWFELRKRLKLDEKIVQLNPFESLTIVAKKKCIDSFHIISHGVDRNLIQRAEQEVTRENYTAAEQLFLTCLLYHPLIPEAVLGLVRCNLLKGYSAQALEWILKPIQRTLEVHGASEPDPVEWGYYLRCLVCGGNLEEALIRASEFSSLRHPDLNRTRVAINILNANKSGTTLAEQDSRDDAHRPSVHQFSGTEFIDWIDEFCTMLKACGQIEFSEILNRNDWQLADDVPDHRGDAITTTCLDPSSSGWLEPKKTINSSLSRGAWRRKIRSMLATSVRWGIRRLFGNKKKSFRKYLLLKSTVNHFFLSIERAIDGQGTQVAKQLSATVRSLAEREKVSDILIVGALALGSAAVIEPVLSGARRNPANPKVSLIAHSESELNQMRVAYSQETVIKSMNIPIGDFLGGGIGPSCMIIIVDGGSNGAACIQEELPKAKIVFLGELSTLSSCSLHRQLSVDRNYQLLGQYPTTSGGFAAFRRIGIPKSTNS